MRGHAPLSLTPILLDQTYIYIYVHIYIYIFYMYLCKYMVDVGELGQPKS